MQAKKRRLPRVERYEMIKVHEDDNQHLWAVSYADFLMVLLSFFVIFYSTDEIQQSTIMQKISMHFSVEAKDANPVASDKVIATRLPANFKEIAALYNFQVLTHKENVFIHFPEDFFAPGKHKIDSSHGELVKKILEPLKPFASELNFFFEGHADKDPLKKSKNAIVKDNFVLSSLRASAALDIARTSGIPEDHMFIKAASSNIRNSRSLTIRISPKEDTL